MLVSIKVPDFGVTVDTVIVHKWLVAEGTPIVRGQTIAEIEADKAVVVLESVAAGILLKIVAAEGAQVKTGDVIAYAGDPTDLVPENGGASPAVQTRPAPAAQAEVHTVSKPRVSPILRNFAKTKGVDVEQLVGTGKDGMVTREDILAAASEKPKPSAPVVGGNPQAQLLNFYRDMLLIRILEERIGYLFLEGIIPGTLHQSLGQEAVAVGVCAAMNRDDVITSGHRPHAHAIAKGVDLTEFILELFGKPGGCCGGKGGSMHVGDLSVGMIPSLAIVGANLPIGAGAALSFKLRREPRVAVCFIGDGGVAEGAFHEAVNLAAVWNLPVVFVIENNHYAASTHYSRNSKLEQLAGLSAAYAIPGMTIDGNDVVKVYETAGQAIERARRGGGPTIIEAMTYRLTGHNRRDPRNYMPSDERERAEGNDPILRFEEALIASGVLTRTQAADTRNEIEQQVEQAVQTAMAAPDANPEDAFKDVYA